MVVGASSMEMSSSWSRGAMVVVLGMCDCVVICGAWMCFRMQVNWL
jgi:hypothetical protein